MSIRLMLPLALLLAACTQTPKTTDSMPPLTMEEQMALNVTGAEHEWMAPMVGKFHGKISMNVDPAGEPMLLEGTMVNSRFMDGRWLRQDWTADWNGMPMQGFGLFGYDTLLERYQGFWIDNMATYMAPIMNGHAIDDRAVETHGQYWDPNTGTTVTRRDVVRIIDRNHHTYEMYQSHAGEEEFQVLHIDYSRMADDGSLQDGEVTDEMRAALEGLGYVGG